MQDDGAAMSRVERRLIRFLDITAPAERNAEDVLPAAVALWMLAQEMGGLPDAMPAERRAWAAIGAAIDRGARDARPLDSDYLRLRHRTLKAALLYVPTDALRPFLAELKKEVGRRRKA